jgi:hypothetical protein
MSGSRPRQSHRRRPSPRPRAAAAAAPPLTNRKKKTQKKPQKKPRKNHKKNQVAFAGLLLKGRQSLKELLRSTRLPSDQLRHALLALITHNLVKAYREPPSALNGGAGGGGGGSATTKGKRAGGGGKRNASSPAGSNSSSSPFLYEGDLDAALWTSLRRPAFLAWVARRWPRRSDRLIAEACVDVLLAEGRLRVDQVAALAARRAAELAVAEAKARPASAAAAEEREEAAHGDDEAGAAANGEADDDENEDDDSTPTPLTTPTPAAVLRVFRELVEDARLVERAPPCDLRPPFPPIHKPPRKSGGSAGGGGSGGGGSSAAAKRQRERDLEEELQRRDPGLDEYLELRFVVPWSHDHGGVDEEGDYEGWADGEGGGGGAGGAGDGGARKKRRGGSGGGGGGGDNELEDDDNGAKAAKRPRRGVIQSSSSSEDDEQPAKAAAGGVAVKPEPGTAPPPPPNPPPPLPPVTPRAYHRAILWRANLEQLNRALRREDMVAHVRDRLGPDAACVARAMLELGEQHEYSRRQGFAPSRGPWLTVDAIARRIRDAGCGGLSMTLAVGATAGLAKREGENEEDDEDDERGGGGRRRRDASPNGSSSSTGSLTEEEEELERQKQLRLQRGGLDEDDDQQQQQQSGPARTGPGDCRGRRAAQASWRADGGARLRAEVAEVLERRLACDPAGFVLSSPHQPPLPPPREAHAAAQAAANSSGRPSRAALRRAARQRDADVSQRQYRLVHVTIVGFERLRWLRCCLRGRYGERGLRAFNLLLQKGFLEQRQVAEQCLAPLREARELLYRMLRDGVLSLQDVPRSADRTAPSRSAYLFGADQRRAAERLGQDALRAMARAHARRRHELAPAREILPKVAAARAAGRLTFNLPPEDLRRLHGMVKRGKALDALLLRLDAQSALFNNW